MVQRESVFFFFNFAAVQPSGSILTHFYCIWLTTRTSDGHLHWQCCVLDSLWYQTAH